MTLMITVFAAVISTVVWYASRRARGLYVSALCCMYWGASLMWLVDGVFGFLEDGAEFFAPAAGDMLNDAFLGLCAVALGLIVWVALLLIKDPEGVVREALLRSKKA